MQVAQGAALDLIDGLTKIGVSLKPVGLLKKLAAGPLGSKSRDTIGIWDARPPSGSRLAWVDCGLLGFKQTKGGLRSPDATFPLRYYADWISLKHAVTVSMAHQVVLIGASSQSLLLAKARLGPDVEVRALAPTRQLALE